MVALFLALLSSSLIPSGVERYSQDLSAVMKSSGPISLEPVFESGISAADDLVREQLERFDQPTYRKVQSAMVGFAVSREEVIVAAPLADFFLKLAREKGTSVDRAFFEALKRTYPEGTWPAYYRAQTDYSGCTVFDSNTLTETYGSWLTFQKAYPGRYRSATEKELEGIEAALESTCACGGEEGVRNGLEKFLKGYPNSALAAKVSARLQAIRNRTSGIRFYCKAQ